MRDIHKVYNVYRKIDIFFADKIANTRTSRKRQQWADRRSLNDQAYFVMIFAQFEDHINEKCRKLIRKKQNLSKWTSRGLWDDLNERRVEKLGFVALLTEKGYTDYNMIHNYYKIRCDIAHGGNYSPISIYTVTNDLLNIARRLKF